MNVFFDRARGERYRTILHVAGILVGTLLIGLSALPTTRTLAGQPQGDFYAATDSIDTTSRSANSQPEEVELLPSVDTQEDLVLHAGGTVELRLPVGWQVREVPDGREVRLYAGPAPLSEDEGPYWPGLWLIHAPQPSDRFRQPRELIERLRARLRKSTDREARLVGEPRPTMLGRWGAWRLDFEIAGREETGGNRLVGYHLLARTDAGLFELHVALPENAEKSQQVALERIVASMRITSPQAAGGQAAPTMADAEQIVGTWKAIRARWRLAPNGRVQVEFDRAGTFALDESGSVRFDQPLTRLDGVGIAEGDVLKITWDDGSRLNLRWTLHRGDLLVTDHTGRTSQLKRLFD